MKTIIASCVDEALFHGINLLLTEGQRSKSRVGEVLAIPCPVMTVNLQPMNRVLFSAQRDANPFFHLNEALWMLAGRNDIEWLDQFVKDFSKNFGEKDPLTGEVYQHGAYGFRWRQHFDMDAGGPEEDVDQLEKVILMLKSNPNERRAVIGMWDPVADLDKPTLKDVPCNTHIYLRVRTDPHVVQGRPLTEQEKKDRWSPPLEFNSHVLDLTVCCRSNDAIWGAHGANAVHFSVLQEYLAMRIGVGMGTLYQLSNNYHGYLDKMHPLIPFEEVNNRYRAGSHRHGCLPTNIVTNSEEFDNDLALYFSNNWISSAVPYKNQFFVRVAIPLRVSYELLRKGQLVAAREELGKFAACDWIIAAQEWYDRRLAKRKAEGDAYAL